MCYPQQLGRSWKDFVSEPFGTLSAMCNGHLSNSVCYLHQNHPELHRLLNQNLPEPHQLSAPKQSGSLSAFCHIMPSNSPQTLLAICTGTLRTSSVIRNPPKPCLHHTVRNLISHLHRNPLEPSGTSSAICTGTLRNLISHLHWIPPELHQLSAPQPSRTSSAICAGTLRNFISHLHRNPPEPCLLSAPVGTLWNFITGTLRNLIICTGTLRNLISHLPRNTPERHQPSTPEISGTSSAICTGTLRNLLRNLVLQLHRIAPELFWAKDPIASFAVGEKELENNVTTWQHTSNISGAWHPAKNSARSCFRS